MVTNIRHIQKVFKPHPRRVGETRQFFTIFQYSSVVINALGPTMLKYYCPIVNEGGFLVFQKFLPSTYDFIIVSQNGYHTGWIWF